MSKSGLSVTVDMVSLWRLLICLMVIISFRMILLFILGLQNDGPPRWENGMMNIQLVCFEEEAAKDSGHSEGLTIRQVHKIWCHWVNDRAGYVSDTSAIAQERGLLDMVPTFLECFYRTLDQLTAEARYLKHLIFPHLGKSYRPGV